MCHTAATQQPHTQRHPSPDWSHPAQEEEVGAIVPHPWQSWVRSVVCNRHGIAARTHLDDNKLGRSPNKRLGGSAASQRRDACCLLRQAADTICLETLSFKCDLSFYLFFNTCKGGVELLHNTNSICTDRGWLEGKLYTLSSSLCYLEPNSRRWIS